VLSGEVDEVADLGGDNGDGRDAAVADLAPPVFCCVVILVFGLVVDAGPLLLGQPALVALEGEHAGLPRDVAGVHQVQNVLARGRLLRVRQLRDQGVEQVGRVAELLANVLPVTQQDGRADGEPLVIEQSQLHFIGCERLLEEDLEQNSLYRQLETKYGISLLEAEQELEAGLAGREEEQLLKIPAGSPVLFTRRTTYTERDQPIEYAKAVYCGSKYTFYTNMKREQLIS